MTTTREEREYFERSVAAFETAWQGNRPPDLRAALPGEGHPLRKLLLIELIKIDQEFRWKAGDYRTVEQYIAAWPEVRSDVATVVELVSAECLTSETLGVRVNFKALRTRFPSLCEHIPLAAIRKEAKHDKQVAKAANERPSRSEEPSTSSTLPEGEPMSLLQIGQVIRGTYEVERPLGEGAFAEVYRVKHRFLGRQAMKVFKMVGMTIAETEQMLGEALMLSQIGHPNIIRVFDANTTDTSRGICGFFTMEYIAGGNLQQFWQSHGNSLVPVATAIDLICQVCRGLALAHSETPPIVHRDIKPQNILVGYDARGLRARLSDFGLARHVNPLTMLASAKGTPRFKAPEVFRDSESDSCAGDVWSIGTTLYLLLTDRMPIPDGEEGHRFDATRDYPIIPPSRLNIQVDERLESIVMRSLSSHTKERYQNATALLADLERWTPSAVADPPSLPSTANWNDSKNALGRAPSDDELEARQMAKHAMEFACQASKLAEAADLMEEAFNRWPELRTQYASQLTLWRCGICTPSARRKQ